MGTFGTIIKRLLTLRNLLLLGTIVAFGVAIAQTQNGPANGRILIDGAQEPDRVPEWVLWDAVFRMAVLQSEKSPGQGEELWVDKLHLPRNVMTEIIQQGLGNRDFHAANESEARQIVAVSRTDANREKVRVKLRKVQGFAEVRTIEMRDKLRARIGEDAFLRIQSYAQLNIVPRIILGY
jgi:hypothetical protein